MVENVSLESFAVSDSTAKTVEVFSTSTKQYMVYVPQLEALMSPTQWYIFNCNALLLAANNVG